MRSRLDRVRHAVLFELIALVLSAPLGSLLFGVGVGHFGVVAAVSTSIAMGWTYLYNLGFDHALLRVAGTTRKSVAMRVGHAVLFEAGLTVILVPFIAWYLGVGWWRAFVMDVALSGFYLVFAFVFNWTYDAVFPVPPERT